MHIIVLFHFDSGLSYMYYWINVIQFSRDITYIIFSDKILQNNKRVTNMLVVLWRNVRYPNTVVL